jgi:hypothetical protein
VGTGHEGALVEGDEGLAVGGGALGEDDHLRVVVLAKLPLVRHLTTTTTTTEQEVSGPKGRRQRHGRRTLGRAER